LNHKAISPSFLSNFLSIS